MTSEIGAMTKALFALEGFFAESLELHTGASRSAAELKANEAGIKEMMKAVEGVGSVCKGNGAYRITIGQALAKMKKAGHAKDALKGRKDAEKSAEAIMAFRVAFAKLEGKLPTSNGFKMLAHQKAAADRALKYWAKEKGNMTTA